MFATCGAGSGERAVIYNGAIIFLTLCANSCRRSHCSNGLLKHAGTGVVAMLLAGIGVAAMLLAGTGVAAMLHAGTGVAANSPADIDISNVTCRYRHRSSVCSFVVSSDQII